MNPLTSAILYPAMKTAVPQAEPEKEKYVRTLFDGIAPRYDFLNHLLSGGFDILWRRKAIRLLNQRHPRSVLDIATGTGDFAIEAATGLRADVTGVDISENMLRIGRAKVAALGRGGQIRLQTGKAEALDFPARSFDAVTVAFGVRNFADVGKGLAEMARVLRPGGTAVILEFSTPKGPIFGPLFSFYFRRILPAIGGFVSRSRSSYEYLPESVRSFPDGDDFLRLLRASGFSDTAALRLTLGIATIYTGIKTDSY